MDPAAAILRETRRCRSSVDRGAVRKLLNLDFSFYIVTPKYFDGLLARHESRMQFELKRSMRPVANALGSGRRGRSLTASQCTYGTLRHRRGCDR